jgi:Clp amino terminal domain, pathogenicity island component
MKMSEASDNGFSRRAFLKLAGLAAAVGIAVASCFRLAWAGDRGKGDSDKRRGSSDTNATPEAKGSIWQRFTERARRVVFFAQEEAARLGENYVGTEHLLLGLVRENDSVAAQVLDRMGISGESVRGAVLRQVTRGSGNLGQDMQLTPRAKRVIDLAYEQARQLKNNYIGTEHLLLGLIGEEGGLAGRVLRELGADLKRARRVVAGMQSGN